MTKENFKYIIAIAVVLLALVAMNPNFFIPLLIIAIIFYQPILKIIQKNMPEGQIYDYTKIVGEKFKFGSKVAIVVVIVVLLLILLFRSIVIIPAGNTGVYHLFGKVKDKELSSGIHLVIPLAQVEMMSIRTEQYTMSIATSEGQRLGDDSIDAITKEGLTVKLDMTILYHLIEDQASDVFKNIGLDYSEKIIRPEVRNAIREVIALYEAKDIYSEKRQEAATKILEKLRAGINPRGIEVESVLLRNVILPPMVTKAIEDKLTAEQEAQKYDFVLQKEEKEAERKRIEAQGQRDSQQIINQSLSSQYLQYLYIKELQNRPGTIYVPYDLPLFKGIQ